jgi:hypothetical protein
MKKARSKHRLRPETPPEPEVIRGIEVDADRKIRESRAELSDREQSADEIRKDFLERAAGLRKLMQKKYFELTGEKNSFEIEDLYRDKVREMMVNIKLISPEAYSALKEDCRKKGKAEPLSRIKTENGATGKEVKECLKEIPEEAAEIEDISLLFIKSYASNGDIVPSLFIDQLATYLSDQAADKKRSEMGLAMQKDLNAYGPKEEKKPTLSHKEEQDETFKTMSSANKNRYIVSKKNLHEKGYLHEGKLKNFHKAMRAMHSDPVIANDFKFFLRYNRKFYVEAHEMHLLQAEKTMRQADILGIHF